MVIQIDPHTLKRAEERGTNEKEIADAINTGTLLPAKYGRIAKAKIFNFEKERHGRYYDRRKWKCFIPLRKML